MSLFEFEEVLPQTETFFRIVSFLEANLVPSDALALAVHSVYSLRSPVVEEIVLTRSGLGSRSGPLMLPSASASSASSRSATAPSSVSLSLGSAAPLGASPNGTLLFFCPSDDEDLQQVLEGGFLRFAAMHSVAPKDGSHFSRPKGALHASIASASGSAGAAKRSSSASSSSSRQARPPGVKSSASTAAAHLPESAGTASSTESMSNARVNLRFGMFFSTSLAAALTENAPFGGGFGDRFHRPVVRMLLCRVALGRSAVISRLEYLDLPHDPNSGLTMIPEKYDSICVSLSVDKDSLAATSGSGSLTPPASDGQVSLGSDAHIFQQSSQMEQSPDSLFDELFLINDACRVLPSYLVEFSLRNEESELPSPQHGRSGSVLAQELSGVRASSSVPASTAASGRAASSAHQIQYPASKDMQLYWKRSQWMERLLGPSSASSASGASEEVVAASTARRYAHNSSSNSSSNNSNNNNNSVGKRSLSSAPASGDSHRRHAGGGSRGDTDAMMLASDQIQMQMGDLSRRFELVKEGVQQEVESLQSFKAEVDSKLVAVSNFYRSRQLELALTSSSVCLDVQESYFGLMRNFRLADSLYRRLKVKFVEGFGSGTLELDDILCQMRASVSLLGECMAVGGPSWNSRPSFSTEKFLKQLRVEELQAARIMELERLLREKQTRILALERDVKRLTEHSSHGGRLPHDTPHPNSSRSNASLSSSFQSQAQQQLDSSRSSISSWNDKPATPHAAASSRPASSRDSRRR